MSILRSVSTLTFEILYHSRGHNSLLRMKTILCLIKNNGMRAVDDALTHFFPAVGGQAVHEQVILLRIFDQSFIDLEVLKRDFALLLLCFLPHARPYICVDDVSILNSFAWIARNE
ncbi:hypothetical protein D3C84_846470 [compost metagenome]